MIPENLVETDEYKQLCEILDNEYGVSVGESDRAIVEAKIKRYYERHGFDSLSECLAFIRSDGARLKELGEVVYSPSTHFNRQPRHFRFMTEKLAQERAENSASPAPTKIWCLGCSTGQEAYTAAIYLREFMFSDVTGAGEFSVVGSDCSPNSLQQAQAGSYAIEDIERLRPLNFARYFSSIREGRASVGDDIKSRVTFTYFNLTTSEYLPTAFDFIFLRNALDFHHLRSKLAILKNVRSALRPGGYLILGDCPTLGGDVVCSTGYEWLESGCYKVV